MEEMKAAKLKARYGDVCEISREDYVREVNQAGEGIWVILLVYKPSLVQLCCCYLYLRITVWQCGMRHFTAVSFTV